MDAQLERRLVEALERIADALAPKEAAVVAPHGSCPVCGGSEEKQTDASTMTAPNQKKCLICQAEYSG